MPQLEVRASGDEDVSAVDPHPRSAVLGLPGRGDVPTTIGQQITSRSLLLTIVPLMILGLITVVSFAALRRGADERIDESRLLITHQSIGKSLEQEAQLLLDRIDAALIERVDDVVAWSRNPVLVEAAGTRRNEVRELEDLSIGEIEARYGGDFQLDTTGASSAYLQAEVAGQAAVAELFFTDANGFNVAASNPTSDFVQSDEDWWMRAWDNGVFVGEIALDESSGALAFDIAARIEDPATGRGLGVVKAVVQATTIQEMTDAFALAQEADAVEVTVIDGTGRILAETDTNHRAARLANPDVDLDEELAFAFDRASAQGHFDGFAVFDEVVVGYARTQPMLTVERLRLDIATPGWIVLIEEPTDLALRPLAGLESIRSSLASSSRNLTIGIVLIVGIAIALASAVSRVVARRITEPINRLRAEAHRVADEDLPRLVESLRDPDSTDDSVEAAPIDIAAEGEVGELVEAFNTVRSTAVRLAGEQAVARRQVTGMLRNLGRRNQQLVGRQLRHIDDLERGETNPEALAALSDLDAIASRMRRNAESLVVLAGDSDLRAGGSDVPVKALIQGVIDETHGAERVRITALEPAVIRGHVAGDLAHLLAELIDNAVNFSPPGTPVAVVGSQTLDGPYSISVVDQGIGMSRERMAEANSRIARPVITDDPSSSYLGLYVVGRLAARHDIDARLVESATEGVTAKLTLPAACFAQALVPARASLADASDSAAADKVDLTTLAPRSPRGKRGGGSVVSRGASKTQGVADLDNPARIAARADQSVNTVAARGSGSRLPARPVPPAESLSGSAAESAAATSPRALGPAARTGLTEDQRATEPLEGQIGAGRRRSLPSAPERHNEFAGSPSASPGGHARAEVVRDRLSSFADGVRTGRATTSSPGSKAAVERARQVRDGLNAFTRGIERGRAAADSDSEETNP